MRPLILTLAAVLTASSALAQMSDVDTDEDGMASYDEVIAVYPGVTEDQFAEMDTNGDGSLDEAEMTAAIESGSLVMPE